MVDQDVMVVAFLVVIDMWQSHSNEDIILLNLQKFIS